MPWSGLDGLITLWWCLYSEVVNRVQGSSETCLGLALDGLINLWWCLYSEVVNRVQGNSSTCLGLVLMV